MLSLNHNIDFSKTIERIKELKEERKALLLVHNYQRREIQEIGDFVGDSLELAKIGQKDPRDLIILSGVRFMAETAKILNPEKRVILAREDAGCPMADMVSVRIVEEMREKYPNAKVVAYVNTSAEVKAHSDICCTSSNALKVIESLDCDEVIFVPDKSLAAYLQEFTTKKIRLSAGYCPTHHRILKEQIIQRKEEYPDAVVICHPECTRDVLDLADYIESTSGMVRLARELPAKVFIVGTEEGLIQRLKRENPDKTFVQPSNLIMCPNMKKTTLNHILNALENFHFEILIPEQIRLKALGAVQRMMSLN